VTRVRSTKGKGPVRGEEGVKEKREREGGRGRVRRADQSRR
jgi:hypothetical protein